MKRTALVITPLCILVSASLAAAQPSATPAELDRDTDDESHLAADPQTPGDASESGDAGERQVARSRPERQSSESYEVAAKSDGDAELSAEAAEREPRLVEKRMLHGFRVGYNFIMNARTREDGTLDIGPGSDKVNLKSPHLFVLGYEGFYRIVGHSWLNVLAVGNVSVAGLEQSKFIPSANGLIGFEFNESFQLGVGINVTPVADSVTHLIAAGGWTPKVGSFYVPFHLFFMPDKDGFHRTGATLGVTW